MRPADVPWWMRRGPHTIALEALTAAMVVGKLLGCPLSWWWVFAPVWGWCVLLVLVVPFDAWRAWREWRRIL